MNVSDLEAQLKKNAVPDDAYCLTGGLPNEAYCIEQDENGRWRTYYSERGQRTGVKYFTSEDEACHHLLRTLVKCGSRLLRTQSSSHQTLRSVGR